MSLVKSQYNFSVTLPDGRLGLYNSKTGAVVVSQAAQAAALLAVLDDPGDHVESDLLLGLRSQGFLVEDNHDELADILSWHSRYVTDQRLVHVTMLPAEACNFACPYCFQYNKRHVLMKPWVYEATLRMIERMAVENRSKGETTHVKVSWFGGEPTLATREVLVFQNRLRELRDHLDIVFHSTMVTNGYLLSPRLFRRLLDADIREFQVTLDGDKTTHDQLRVLKSGKPTFETIYGNLKEIAKLPSEFQFKMAIRANFLRTTVSSVRNLVEMFMADFGRDPRFSIYCRPVYNFPTARTDIQTVASDICGIEEGLGLQNAFAITVMERLGPSTLGRMFDPLPMPTPAWCPNERQYSYVIGADGLLFPCDTFVGDEDHAIGRLSETGVAVYNQKFNAWKRTIFSMSESACLSCRLLPVCMGGCLRERITSSGRPPCFWREEDILWALREYIEFSSDSLHRKAAGELPSCADNEQKEVRRA